MKKYLFFILTICFSIGIIISELLIPATNLQIIFFLIVALLFISVLKNNNRQNIYAYLGISIILGIYIHQNYNQDRGKKIIPTSKIFFLEIINQGNETKKYQNYIVKDLETNQQLILHLKHQDQKYYPNDEVIVYSKSTEIQDVLNPNQFDYKKFLARKRIYAQLFAENVISKHKDGKGFYNYYTCR